MNIAVVNASVATGKSQPSQKNSYERSDEFNKTFSSFLNKNSMESSSEQTNDEKETTEMMDDLASLMVSLPLLNLTQLPRNIEGDMALVKEANLELETGYPLINVLNVQDDSIENSDLLQNDATSDEVDHLSQGERSSTTAQSQVGSELQKDENKSLSINPQQQVMEMDSMLVDKQGNFSLKEILDKSPSQEKGLLQHIQTHAEPLELDSFEGEMKSVQELLKDDLKSNQELFEGEMKSVQELLEDDLKSNQELFEGEMKSVQESMVINHGTVSLKDVTVHEAPSKPISDLNYFKWDNQAEIMSNLRHQISILEENDYTTLQLKLYPQHLGSISVELKMKNGVLNAHVLVEQPELKSAIEQEFHQINLDGTQIGQLNVEVNAQSQQQSKSQKATKTSRSFTLEDEPLDELEMIQKENEHTGYLNLTV